MDTNPSNAWQEPLQAQGGWSERTTADAGRWAVLRFTALGLTVHPDSRIMRAIKRIDRAVARGDRLGQPAHGPTSALAEAHRTVVESYVIARVTPGLATMEAQEPLERMLRGGDTPAQDVSSQNTQARDAQLELFAGGMLRLAGQEVRLAEPDLVIRLPHGRDVGVAAKRSWSEPSLRKQLSKAATQLARPGNHGPGFIVLSLDRVLADAQAADPACPLGDLFYAEISRASQVAESTSNRGAVLAVIGLATTFHPVDPDGTQHAAAVRMDVVYQVDSESEEAIARAYFGGFKPYLERHMPALWALPVDLSTAAGWDPDGEPSEPTL
jgi:hypothetical protein